MGKVRKPRGHGSRTVASADISEEQLSESSNEKTIQTILDQLQEVNIEEKYCGLQTLALLIEGQGNNEEVIRNGVVRATAPLLLDTACSVRNAAAGVLRNLSIGGHDICDALMEQDIMTPLTHFFHEFTETWVPDKSMKSKEDSETIVHCIHILLNLCESSGLAIKYLGQSRVLDILPRYLELGVFNSNIVSAVLQCLLVVVEDNPVAIEKVKPYVENQLQQLLALESGEPDHVLLKTLAVGVTINLCGGSIISLPPTVISRLIAILSESLSGDHRQICNDLSSIVPLKDGNGKIVPPKGKDAQDLENQIKSVSFVLDAQRSAVEIIANLCSSADNDDSIDDSSDGEDMPVDEISNSKSTTDTLLSEDKLPPDVLEGMVSLEIFKKVWTKAQQPAENVMMILKEYEGSQSIYKKVQILQTGALLCVNNMILTLPIENLGGVNDVYKLWVDAGKLVFRQASDNTDLLESATAVMRAALDKIKCREHDNSNENLFTDLALTDIDMMTNGIKECQVPEIRSNLIRMIGTLALLLVSNLNVETSNVVSVITEFIIDQAHRETEVWVLAEAVDTLVDLYSEDETDSLAAKVRLVQKLETLAPVLKSKARQKDKYPHEYKGLVSTATSNLPRFIKYKKDRLAMC